MAPKASTHHQTASIKQILKKCSSFGKKNGYQESYDLPHDVPKGHFVVYVGENRSRYIISLSWLENKRFKGLLQRSEEEFGYCHEMGLTIPCDEEAFCSLVCLMR